jgi:hypothetical protein
MREISDAEIRTAIETRLSVPLWPHCGRALSLGRTKTYEAAAAGDIETIDIGDLKNKSVSTAWIRRKLNPKTT